MLGSLDLRLNLAQARAFVVILAGDPDDFRGMHDLAKPLVRADWNHALDGWRWTLRL